MDVEVHQIEEYSPGRAINMGVDLAATDLILVLSAHCQLTTFNEESLKACVMAHGACFGHQTPIWRGKKITPRYIWSHFGEERVENMQSEIEDRPFFHNALAFFTRETLIKQKFDESYCGKEDRYWAAARIEAGLRYIYSPSILRANHFWTPNGNTWKGLG